VSMSDECLLRKTNSDPGVPCDGAGCTFWQEIGVSPGGEPGCAIQRFGLLDADNEALSAWLLTVKMRVERVTQDGCE